jgi:transposase
MLHSGIDLHKNDLVISTVDGCGTEVLKKRLRTDRPAVAGYFASLPGPHRAVVESTASWYWLADLLKEHDIDLTLAHAKLVKAIAYAKVKTDAIDAHTLGQLLRADLIPPAHMISPELRGTRDLLRVRLRLVQKRGRCQNAIASLVTKYNVHSLDQLPELARLEAECHREQIALLQRQIKRVVVRMGTATSRSPSPMPPSGRSRTTPKSKPSTRSSAGANPNLSPAASWPRS